MYTDAAIFKLFGLFIVFLAILFFIAMLYGQVWLPFKQERDYIKEELRYSDGEEYDYWKAELRRLYICKIPIVRSIVRRKYNR